MSADAQPNRLIHQLGEIWYKGIHFPRGRLFNDSKFIVTVFIINEYSNYLVIGNCATTKGNREDNSEHDSRFVVKKVTGYLSKV